MNPDSSRIKWEFHPQEHAVVVHVPGRGGARLYSFGDNGAPDITNPLQRSIARTLLQNALRALDETEPANPNGAAR